MDECKYNITAVTQSWFLKCSLLISIAGREIYDEAELDTWDDKDDYMSEEEAEPASKKAKAPQKKGALNALPPKKKVAPTVPVSQRITSMLSKCTFLHF